jgi:hypothetical protein
MHHDDAGGSLMKMSLLLASSLALLACTHSATTVSQTGIVPAPRPLAYDGQPLARPVRLEGRYTSVVEKLEPDNGRPSGDYVARDHLGAAVRFAPPFMSSTDIGIAIDTAWSRRSEPVNSDLPERPHQTAWSMVFGIRHSVPISPELRLGVGVDMGFLIAPVRVGGSSESESDGALIASLGVVPSYRTGNFTLFGGFHLVSEVNVPRTLVVDDSFDAPEAEAEGGALVLSGGASINIESGMHVMAQLAKPFSSEFADHGVQVDFMLAFDLGRTEPRAAPRPVYQPVNPQYPPATYPYPPPPTYPYPPPAQPYPQPSPAPYPQPAPPPPPAPQDPYAPAPAPTP